MIADRALPIAPDDAAAALPDAAPDGAPQPGHVSYSSLSTYDACPRRYAYAYVERVPSPEPRPAFFTFGSAAHAAFETFTRERRKRTERGEAPPTREELGAFFAAASPPAGDPRRVDAMLDTFYAGELASASTVAGEEVEFSLTLESDEGGVPVAVHGWIDRIDRLPGGGIEVIDYKTGRAGRQQDVDESLQLSIYALACRDALGLGAPERVTLSYPESSTRLSTTRTDEQLDAVQTEILVRVARIRSGDFAATPSPRTCEWCEYRAMCPERAGQS